MSFAILRPTIIGFPRREVTENPSQRTGCVVAPDFRLPAGCDV
jgi:hypothetical protein